MNCMFVLYDEDCGLCLACSRWLARQKAFVELRFIPFQSREIPLRFPGLREWPELDLREKLVVIADNGAVYQGQNAWIMCLYALEDYRIWAQSLAHPLLLPFARSVCEAISHNRIKISHYLRLSTAELAREFSFLRTS